MTATAIPNVSTDTPAPDELDAFSQGVEAARAAEPDPLPPAPEAPADPAQPEDNQQDTSADGPPDPAKDEDEQQDAPDDPPPPEDDDGAAPRDDTAPRQQKRFRELKEELDTLKPLAERGREWEETLQSTGATPQQFGNMLNYLAAINSGDPTQMGKAYEAMQAELAWLGKQLGKPAPGYDPLAEHADLKAKIEEGTLSPEAAQELISARRQQALYSERQQQTLAQQQQQAAQQQALDAVAALGERLRAADGAAFSARFKTIEPMVKMIQDSLPPGQWAAAIEKAYQAAPVVPAAPRAVAANPARVSGAPPQVPAPDPDDAFAFGVELARQQGR